MHSENAKRGKDDEEVEVQAYGKMRKKKRMEIVEMEDSINKFAWEVYEYIVEYMSGRWKIISNRNEEN